MVKAPVAVPSPPGEVTNPIPSLDAYGASTARGKVRSQLIVGGEEVLGQDASLPDGRHEIGISRPAGEQVHVQVIRHAGACTTS